MKREKDMRIILRTGYAYYAALVDIYHIPVCIQRYKSVFVFNLYKSNINNNINIFIFIWRVYKSFSDNMV